VNGGAQPRKEPSEDSGGRSHGDRHRQARTGPSVPAALVDVPVVPLAFPFGISAVREARCSRPSIGAIKPDEQDR
jgi:hypothetical protein